MFRFNQNKANREVDEIKKLLAITKGARNTNKSISSSFLKEELDASGNQIGSTSTPVDMQTPGETAKSDDMKEIENAIETSEISEITPDKVKGTILNGKIKFEYDGNKTSPIINNIELTDDTNKIINQIKAYFDIWKKKPK